LEIATALQYSSNSAQQAGISFDELASYVTVLSSVTRRSAESIGQSLKTMFARMENIKLGKMFEDDATTLNDVERALTLVNIKLRDTETSFRPMGDVMDEIAEKWSTMNEIEQSAVANAIAGVRQRENFLVLMSNYNEVLNAQAIQLHSLGLATERYEIYMDSIEGKANTLKASMENLWQKAIDDDVIKFFLDLGISSAEAIDKMGGLIPILESIIGLVAVLSAQTMANFIVKILGAATAVQGFSFSLISLQLLLKTSISWVSIFQVAIVALTAVIITYQQTVKKQQDLGLESTTNAWSNAFKNLGEEIKTTEQIMGEYKKMVDSVNEAHNKAGLIADLFVDKQKILDQGLKEVIVTLKDTTSNYNDYIEAVEKAAELAGYTVTENGKLVRTVSSAGKVVVKTADDFGVLTDAELALFNATKAELDTWVTAWKRAHGQIFDSTEELSQAFDDLQYILDDSFGKAFDSYHEKQEKAAIQAAELREEIRLLSEQPTSTDEQLTQLGDLQYELYNVEQDILKTADAYEKSLQASIISTFIQRVSLSELSLDAKNAAYNMAADMMQAWGLMGAETVRVMGAMDQALVDLANGAYDSAQLALEAIYNLGTAASAISGNYYMTFWVNTVTGNVVSPGTLDENDPLWGLQNNQATTLAFNPPPTNVPTRSSFPGFSGSGSSGGSGGGGSSAAPKEEIKTLKDLHNLVISLIKAEKNAIKDSLKEQLDAYEEIIDAKKEILKAEQESIEYQEELEDKTKGIAKIQSEMAILALDTSAESKARQLELAEELSDAQKDLEQTQRDRSYDLQEEALDKEYDLYKENIDLQIAAIDEYLDKTGQIAQDALNIIGEQAPNLYQSLIDWNEEYGSGIKTDVIEAWNEAYDALLKYGNLADALYGGVSPTASTETLPTHHSGLSSGAVGGVRTLPGEVLSKLLVGEEVMNNNDILKTLKMIPSVANIINRSQGSGGLNIESLITVQGDVIERTIPKIKDIARDVIKEINSTLVRQGSVRDVASIYG